MTGGEVAGYIASALVFATFYMKTMLPLRMVGIFSNIAFITYASLQGLLPVLILHSALLPLNIVRLLQLRAQLREIGEAVAGDFSIKPLLPLMKQTRYSAGEVLFRAGDPSDELYFLASGTVELPEVDATIGPGTLFGEFGLFSPSGKRTATAIAGADVTVFGIKQQDVLNALLQHPKLGILLLRLITARLMENADREGGQSFIRDADVSTDPSSVPALKAASQTAANLRLWAAILLVGLLLTMLAVAFGPRLHFVIARQSAVTTWIDFATSPIQGTITTQPPQAGAQMDQSGLVAEISNASASLTPTLRAAASFERAQAELVRLRTYEEQLRALDSELATRTNAYAAGFQRNLDVTIEGLEQEVRLMRERVELAEASLDRMLTLGTSGTVSLSAQEEARRDLLDHQESLTAKEKILNGARLRRELADRSVYLEGDGRSPDWAYQSRDAVRIELERLSAQIIDAESEVDTAEKFLRAEETGLINTSAARVTIPEGSTIWARLANQGEAVNVGTTIVEWIDCDSLLIDVPTSNLVTGLLKRGMAAQILIEGESDVHEGKVLLTRGPGAKLTGEQLAATASGHSPDTAQAIVEFLPDHDLTECPVGRAASVTFPDVGVISLVRALFRMS